MTRKEIRDAIDAFLALLDGTALALDPELALRVALDRLALASHFAHAPFDEREHPEPSTPPYAAFRAQVNARFPRLGYYNAAVDVARSVGEGALGVSDAIDDLADIARELHEVLLRWDQNGEDDALWHFHFGFEAHWGMHLRSLQLYLHERAAMAAQA